MHIKPILVRILSCNFHTNGIGKIANSKSVAMLIAILVSAYAGALKGGYLGLTAVEDADFLEDVRTIARSCSKGWPKCQVVTSSDRCALEDDGQH